MTFPEVKYPISFVTGSCENHWQDPAQLF